MARFLGGLIPGLIKPVIKQRGFLTPRILLEWEKIVGPDFSSHCVPDRIQFPQGHTKNGTLYLIIDPKSAFRFDYIKDLIIEKINIYFGYGAIRQIKIFQKPMALKPAFEKKKSLTPIVGAQKAFIPVDHDRLQQALLRYGSSLSQRDQKQQDDAKE